ncbi:MAG: MotA/TolQ/ExbB proton channel family protein [Solirubrobacteraceae bacterium]|nr:MotA/TolQ/ExbB proton channel family protein [Solirubrobacteraceae bacterium]
MTTLTLAASAPERVVFDLVELLRYPVLFGVVLALALALYELGILATELYRRRGRIAGGALLDDLVPRARTAIAADDRSQAANILRPIAKGADASAALGRIVEATGTLQAEPRAAKALADFDLRAMRRLERPRMLVRAGPALGLMGTLIPLSPALAGLARGDVQRLSDDLRVAFAVTVIGLLTGALAFGVALVRDRLAAQDLSDLEYVAATLAEPAA